MGRDSMSDGAETVLEGMGGVGAEKGVGDLGSMYDTGEGNSDMGGIGTGGMGDAGGSDGTESASMRERIHAMRIAAGQMKQERCTLSRWMFGGGAATWNLSPASSRSRHKLCPMTNGFLGACRKRWLRFRSVVSCVGQGRSGGGKWESTKKKGLNVVQIRALSTPVLGEIGIDCRPALPAAMKRPRKSIQGWKQRP